MKSLHPARTKESIFLASVQMFSERGYSEVTIRQIAKKVGVNESSIYNHYASKQSILDDIFDFYCEHLPPGTITDEQLSDMIESKTTEHVIQFAFLPYPQPSTLMVQITRMLFMEQYRNERAKEMVYRYFILEPTVRMHKATKRLVELNRLPRINGILFAEMTGSMWYGLVQQYTLEYDYMTEHPYGRSLPHIYVRYLVEMAMQAHEMPAISYLGRWSQEAIAWNEKMSFPQPYGHEAFAALIPSVE